jgi:putative two-component system response regulator
MQGQPGVQRGKVFDQADTMPSALDLNLREPGSDVQAGGAFVAQERRESVGLLASVGEYFDYDNGDHTQRVGQAAAQIAEVLGLPRAYISMLRDAAPLHDIGKIAISQRVLLKPDTLTAPERQHMTRHVKFGAQILSGARSPTLCLAAEIAQTHHEHWDGRGYLMGLAGEEIPLGGRITAVADVFDALTHRRPYKLPWSAQRGAAEIRARAGTQFDPRIVAAFEELDPVTLAEGA